MRRREFLALLGGAAVWPDAAWALEPTSPVIGFLHGASPGPFASHTDAFRQALSEAGFVEGRDLTIEYRWAEGRYGQLPELAADLVRRRVSVIAAPGHTGAALAAKDATTTIPIVFGSGNDPVEFGLVASLARPGSNVTGVSFLTAELVAKRLEILRDLMPGVARIAVLVNPTNPTNAETTVREAEAAVRALGLHIRIFHASTSREIDAAFADLAREQPDALFVGPDAFFNSRRVQLATLAAHHRMATTYAVRDYVEVGGLMSYGPSIGEMFRQVGLYTGRILKGARPADLPVMQLTKFELVINRTTAKTLGLHVPDMLLDRADEVIE